MHAIFIEYVSGQPLALPFALLVAFTIGIWFGASLVSKNNYR